MNESFAKIFQVNLHNDPKFSCRSAWMPLGCLELNFVFIIGPYFHGMSFAPRWHMLIDIRLPHRVAYKKKPQITFRLARIRHIYLYCNLHFVNSIQFTLVLVIKRLNILLKLSPRPFEFVKKPSAEYSNRKLFTAGRTSWWMIFFFLLYNEIRLRDVVHLLFFV